jgi:hypothetical protein
VPDYVDEQLHKNQKTGPWMLAYTKRFVSVAFAEQRENDQAVDGDEATVMNYEKGNQKELAEIRYWGLDFGEHDFEDIVKADDEVFGPVEQDDVERVPAQCDNAVYGQHIRNNQSNDRDVSKLLFERFHLFTFDSCLIISLPAGF